ncbi:MAG: carbohydrate ABC transporter permease [Caldilineaceae bacterium]|nr:carbohydrate ABC transporter permease [Caldilineaceae bacterium]
MSATALPQRFPLAALSRIGVYLGLILISFIMIAPFLYLVTSSLKTNREMLAYPPVLLPTVWAWQNYVDTWQRGNFALYFLNSVYISVARTALTVFSSALAAHAFARLNFPGRSLLFIIVLTTLMLPPQVTLIPVYVLIRYMPLMGGNDIFGQGGTGMINSYAGIIIPGYASAVSIFLLRQFMLTLPRDLDDAARIDGASEFNIFSRIILPLTKPAMAAVSLFTFQGTWNEFLWPLLVGQRRELWTLPVALSRFVIDAETGLVEWPNLLAGTVIATMPIVLVFLLTQKYFIRGIALTGIK